MYYMIHDMQKDALDRRLSLRQPSESAGAVLSSAATSQQAHRSRKIAPTRVQAASGAASLATSLPFGSEAVDTASAGAFSPPHVDLTAEASATDLCTSDFELGKPGPGTVARPMLTRLE